MHLAVEESLQGMYQGHGGPFGCVIVLGDEVIGRGHNMVLATNDPTAHAEVVAIRDACTRLGSFQLTGCEVYCSCEPCPMCFGALYWARPDKIYYSNTKADAAAIGFDDQFIYNQLQLTASRQKIPMYVIPSDEALQVFKEWKTKGDKRLY